MTPPQCVVFDVDDTLYLERDYARSGFRAVGRWVHRHLGPDDFDERAWEAFRSGRRRTIFNEVLAELGIEAEPGLVRRLVDVYRTHRPDIALLEDARACLDWLQGRAVLWVVTGGPPASQHNKVEALGLTAWVSGVVYSGELGPGLDKPHPRAFERVEEGAHISGSRCVYVADNPEKDFKGPKSLKWRTVRVRRPCGLHYDKPSGPDVDEELASLTPLPITVGLDDQANA